MKRIHVYEISLSKNNAKQRIKNINLSRSPYGHHTNATNHAILQTMISDAGISTTEHQMIPAPACVPTSFEPVTMLVLQVDDSGEERPEVLTFRDIVVSGCGCK